MNFKALLWKEYRQSRQLLITAASFLVLPYFLVVTIWLYGMIRFGQQFEGRWAHAIAQASVGSLYVSAVLSAFLAAHFMAGECHDRSAEFTGCLPIRRTSSLLVKTVFVLGIVVASLLLNGLVGYLCDAETRGANSYTTEVTNLFRPALIGTVLAFGVSWLVSTLVGRPSVGAASGLASVLVLSLVLMFVEDAFGLGGAHGAQRMRRIYAWSFSIVGIASFLTGGVCYLRRVEP